VATGRYFASVTLLRSSVAWASSVMKPWPMKLMPNPDIAALPTRPATPDVIGGTKLSTVLSTP
jgi:hypothetical protein